MGKCPMTVSGEHDAMTTEVPSCTHNGDTETRVTPGYTRRDCYLCGEYLGSDI